MAQTGLRMRQRRKRRACAMDQELAKVLVPALADAQQPGLPTRRCLPGYESEPSGKVPGPRECFAGSDGCDQGRCIQHADAGDRGQATRDRVGPCPCGELIVELADPPSGMFLGATIVGRLIAKPESLMEIPSSALTMIENKPAAWVVDAKDQRVHRREITITRHTPDSVIVSAGLTSGERVVTAGVQTLHEGQAVKLLGSQL